MRTNTQQSEEDNMVFNYNNVFFSMFYDDYRVCLHRCSEFGLNYVLSGEMMLDDGMRQVHVTKGECVFVPRDLTLKMYKQPKYGERYQGVFVTFTRKFLRQMFDSIGGDRIDPLTSKIERGAIKLPQTSELKSLFASLMPYFEDGVTPSDDIMRLKQQEALIALLHIDSRFAPTMFDFSDPWKIDILEFMNENYMHELTIKDMAHFTGRSPATFKRDFRKVCNNMTPERWITRKRLEKAYELIQSGATKMIDVCYKVGFKNPSHFSTAFKKQYGISPAMVGTKRQLNEAKI